MYARYGITYLSSFLFAYVDPILYQNIIAQEI